MRLRDFLSALDARIRRWVLGETTIEDYLDKSRLDPEHQREWDEAWREYTRLVCLIPEERVKFRRRHGVLGGAQLSLLGAPKNRGAPAKPVEHRSDARIAKRVERIESRLAKGILLVRGQKRAGGFASGEPQLRSTLRQEGYRPKEMEAILSARTARSAAVSLLAWRLKRDVDVIQAAVSRGRRLLSASERRRNLPERKPR